MTYKPRKLIGHHWNFDYFRNKSWARFLLTIEGIALLAVGIWVAWQMRSQPVLQALASLMSMPFFQFFTLALLAVSLVLLILAVYFIYQTVIGWTAQVRQFFMLIALAMGAIWLAWWVATIPVLSERLSVMRTFLFQVAVLALLAFVVYLWWRRRYLPPVIYPFKNLTGDRDRQEAYDALAVNFAELLVLETDRVFQLRHSEELMPESIWPKPI